VIKLEKRKKEKEKHPFSETEISQVVVLGHLHPHTCQHPFPLNLASG
jgi:hypothetical protein